MTKKKSFDCVEMKRKGAKRLYEATKEMSVAQELEYWRNRTEEARLWLQGSKGTPPAPRSARRIHHASK